ncbi:MAG: hemolysin family protein [SAR202 cluster bacterium]|jgi:CBS domain containing-hemolysin-like protein|nr:hemolysin family protein [SAR202 cluster bacterium]
MEIDSSSLLTWLLLFVSANVFFTSALIEAGLKSVQRERLQMLVSEGIPSARRLESLYLTTTDPGNPVAVLKFASLTASLLSSSALIMSNPATQWWLTAALILTIVTILGVMQLIARSIAVYYGERIALRSASYVIILSKILRPLTAIDIRFVHKSTHLLTDPADIEPEQSPTGEPDGEPLDEREVKMIRGVVRLDQTVAREIMVPRVDMVSIEMGTSLNEVARQMMELRHSRIPVYEGNADKIVGVAYARDMLLFLSSDENPPDTLTADLVRPALFIPESKPLEELLNEFQEKQVHIAMVVDEYGGVAGLVTIEDLLEEIVGEIRDEFDANESEIQTVGDGIFLIDARVTIDQINEALQVEVKSNGFDTIGGFVYQQLGKIPSRGDLVEYDGITIEVLSTIGRRLKTLKVIQVRQ